MCRFAHPGCNPECADLHTRVCYLLDSKSVKRGCAFFQIMHGWVVRPTRPCKIALPTSTCVAYFMRPSRPCTFEKYAHPGFMTNPAVHTAPLGCLPRCAFRGSNSVSATTLVQWHGRSIYLRQACIVDRETLFGRVAPCALPAIPVIPAHASLRCSHLSFHFTRQSLHRHSPSSSTSCTNKTHLRCPLSDYATAPSRPCA